VDANRRLEEAYHERVVGWKVAAQTEENADAAEKLWTELGQGRAHLDVACAADTLDQVGPWCQEAMANVLNATANKIRI